MLSFVALALLAAALWTGVGALAVRLASRESLETVPLGLWPAFGLAATSLLTLDLAKLGLTQPWTPAIVAIAAIAGLVIARRSLRRPLTTIAAAAGAVLPILLLFGALFATYGLALTGYLVDTTAGVQAQGANWLMRHGGDFAAATGGDSAVDLFRRYFVVADYPAGSHAQLGLLSRLSGFSALEVYSAQQALTVAAAGLAIYTLVRSLGGGKLAGMFGGAFATCGALVLSYTLMGSIKELTFLPGLIALTVLMIRAPEFSLRSAAVLTGLLVAFGFATIGTAGLAWGLPAGAIIMGRVAWSQGGPRLTHLARAAGLVTVVSCLALAPLLPEIVAQTRLALALSQTNAALAQDPGNLFAPVPKSRALGVWLAPEHRGLPTEARLNSLLMYVAGLLALAGLGTLLWWRRWWGLITIAAMAGLWVVLTARGTMWIDAKLVVLNAPLVAALIALGADGLSRLVASRQLLFFQLVGIVGIGVALSNISLVRGTGVAQMDRYAELERLDARYAGQGPALMTEFDEYALAELTRMRASSASYAEPGGLSPKLTDGSGARYGVSIDTDLTAPREVQRFPLVLTSSSSAGRSTPPSNYARVFAGSYWDLWKRVGPAPLLHEGVGSVAATGAPSCSLVRRVAQRAAEAGGQVVARIRPEVAAIAPVASQASPNWAGTVPFVVGPGRYRLTIPRAMRTSELRISVQGSLARAVEVQTPQGAVLGTLPRRPGGTGNVSGVVRVAQGTRSVHLVVPGRNPFPGDRSPSLMSAILLERDSAPQTLRLAPGEAVGRLCRPGVFVDWLEAVAPERAGS